MQHRVQVDDWSCIAKKYGVKDRFPPACPLAYPALSYLPLTYPSLTGLLKGIMAEVLCKQIKRPTVVMCVPTAASCILPSSYVCCRSPHVLWSAGGTCAVSFKHSRRVLASMACVPP